MVDTFFHFVRFSLGIDEECGLNRLSSEKGFDWKGFFEFSKKQAILGVAFEGLQKLPKELAPSRNVIMSWFGISERIRIRNHELNVASAEIFRLIQDAGYACCILKGQGNALMYPNTASRNPGDVDVWVLASREEIREVAALLAKGRGKVGEETLNHVVVDLFAGFAEKMRGGVIAELHSTPAIVNNPFYNRRLQQWLRSNPTMQCKHIVELPKSSGEIAIPTASFNAIYQLCHLYHHFFFEGIGLRQIIDYYYVVQAVVQGNLYPLSYQGDCKEKNAFARAWNQELSRLGLRKFAGAVMYVLHRVLGLSQEEMLVPMDVRRGKQLLHEILVGGNFGHHDMRYSFGKGFLGHNLLRFWRDARLLFFYPAEALGEPLFRIWNFVWRRTNACS